MARAARDTERGGDVVETETVVLLDGNLVPSSLGQPASHIKISGQVREGS